ncbi:hypothetical protein HYU89_00650 [Candidatus Collierbacteria bacterium]|nr:hypothetical protein [Candidatus Collierbacteria bacterium]
MPLGDHPVHELSLHEGAGGGVEVGPGPGGLYLQLLSNTQSVPPQPPAEQDDGLPQFPVRPLGVLAHHG